MYNSLLQRSNHHNSFSLNSIVWEFTRLLYIPSLYVRVGAKRHRLSVEDKRGNGGVSSIASYTYIHLLKDKRKTGAAAPGPLSLYVKY